MIKWRLNFLSNEEIALIGNPNVGKTVIFNSLTGSKAHVANWPGVTIEKKTGSFNGISITDLPGVYSLTPNAVDDLIARNYILEEKPKLIIDILDGTNLERNLYLGLLLKEMGVPVLFVLNMMDVVEEKGIKIDIHKLSKRLKSPVIPTIAIKEKGIKDLKKSIETFVKQQKTIKNGKIQYSSKIEHKIKQIIQVFKEYDLNVERKDERWTALKLLENDSYVEEKIKSMARGAVVLEKVNKIENGEGKIELAEQRYAKIGEIIEESLQRQAEKFDKSEFLDILFLDKKFGIPIFFMIMWGIFELTFRVAAPFMTLIEYLQGLLGGAILSSLGEGSLWGSFLVDGIINGFGSIIIFLPNILLVFLALSFLEDSGYLARASFVMDRLMYKLGLHGRSFVSMLLGFGCNVPAIMSTRAIESEEDRITTIMANQNMSCGARLPVYVLIAGAVWGSGAASIIFSLYALGILMAILVALIFKKFVFKGEREPFILELGEYRSPTFKSTSIHMWERGKEFVKKAGTIIFVVVIILWILQTFPLEQTDPTESWLYIIGNFFQPIFEPLNFGIIATVGIIFGFLAKEVVVAAFGMMLGIGEESGGLGQAIVEKLGNSSVIAYSYLVFVLLYTPCVAVIGAIKRETGNWKWPLISVVYGFVLAYLMAFIVQLFGGVYF